MSRSLVVVAAVANGRRGAVAAALAVLVLAAARLPPAWSKDSTARHAVAAVDCIDVQDRAVPVALHDSKPAAGVLAPIAAIAVSPDGSRLAVAQEDRTALVCRADNGQVLHRFQGHQDAITCVAFSPDGRRLATSSFDHTVRLWQADDPGQQPLILQGHDNWVFGVAFSPDGKLLASCGYDKSVRLWDVATGALAGKLLGHTAGVRSVAFSPDGKHLASAGSDQTIKLWLIAGRREVATLDGHEGAIRKIAFSPNGKLLASAGEDARVKLWDVAGRRERVTLAGHDKIVWTLAFSPGGATLATGGVDKLVRLWDVDKAALRRTLSAHSDMVTGLCFAPDGQGLFSAGQDQAVMFWKARTLPLPPLASVEEPASLVQLSPDGRWCLSAGKGRAVHVRDMATGSTVHDLVGQQAVVSCAAFSDDGQRLATGSHDKTLRIWNCAKWADPPQIIETRHEKLRAVAWASDGRLISSGWDGTVCVWRPGEAAPLLALPKQHLPINCLAVSPDGRRLATASGDETQPQTPGEVKIWDLASGRDVGKLGPHLGEVKGVLYTPDGRNLVTYGSFLAVRVWTAGSLHEIAAWSVSNSIRSICLTGGGSTLALGDAAGGIELRSLSGAAGPGFKGHQKAVLAIASSSDGTLLASTSDDGTIGFWPTGLKLIDRKHPAPGSTGRTAAELVAGWGTQASLSSKPRPVAVRAAEKTAGRAP